MKRNSETAMNKGRSVISRRIVVTIETPKGSRNKIKYDASSGHFKLSKVMPEGMMFPYDYGFVPSTKAEGRRPAGCASSHR